MMSFYEELGIRNGASLEEIRQAYKTLARVLHPDGQTDEKLRAAAARQMKRLHEILDVLTDPKKRRVYDERLVAAPYPNPLHWTHEAAEIFPPPPEVGFMQSALRHWSWILVGCVILGSGFWGITARGPITRELAVSEFSVPEPKVIAKPAHPDAGELIPDHIPPTAPSGRDLAAVKSALPVLPKVPAPAPVGLSTPAPAPVYSAHAPAIPAPAAPALAASVQGSPFAGEWFYVPAIEKPDPDLYPPLDIDLKLTDKGGILDGQYRGQYKVADAAVSQDVVFQVQGKSPAGSAAELHWTSSDGAAGEIDLNLRQPNLMKVTWWATQLGRQPALSSGAATLLRQQTH